ncbi:MAG: hypothetical protein ACR2JO_00990 [Mycobacteriales bacterium]
MGLRSGEKRLGPADERVLTLLAGPLSAAVHATCLSDQLQSRASGWSSPVRRSGGDCAATCTTYWVPC